MKKRVAVVGAGIAGITAADLLARRHAVTLYEADARLGGHTDTHAIELDGACHRIDSGFIVFNELNYPGFSRWLRELGVATQPSDMSFGVSSAALRLEYGTRDLAGLFADPLNLLRPRFYGMLRDLKRFYREVRTLSATDAALTLGDYLSRHGYGDAFVHGHLVPMCAALWSAPDGEARDIPLEHVVRFMRHHRMLELTGRPQWRVVCGGSASYIDAFVRRFSGEVLYETPVNAVHRDAGGVRVITPAGERAFDAAFLACHSDQALALLAKPTAQERAVLGAMRYRRNRVVVHSDERVMPRRRAAWSSWNAVALGGERHTITYWMNRLQSLPTAPPFFVTVDPPDSLDLQKVHRERAYAHPVYDHAALDAQRHKAALDGVQSAYFCGAYWGAGFHEDAFQSACDAVAAFEARAEAGRAA